MVANWRIYTVEEESPIQLQIWPYPLVGCVKRKHVRIKSRNFCSFWLHFVIKSNGGNNNKKGDEEVVERIYNTFMMI